MQNFNSSMQKASDDWVIMFKISNFFVGIGPSIKKISKFANLWKWRTSVFTDNKIFLGKIKDKLPQGEGTLIFENGEKAIGSFLNGKGNGNFKIYFPDGKLRFEGYCQEGIYHGLGTCYHENGIIHAKGKFINGVIDGRAFLQSQDCNFKYIGDLLEGQPNGIGLSDKNGLIQVGFFDKGNLAKNRICIQVDSKCMTAGILIDNCFTGEVGEIESNGEIRYIENKSINGMTGIFATFFPSGVFDAYLYEGGKPQELCKWKSYRIEDLYQCSNFFYFGFSRDFDALINFYSLNHDKLFKGKRWKVSREFRDYIKEILSETKPRKTSTCKISMSMPVNNPTISATTTPPTGVLNSLLKNGLFDEALKAVEREIALKKGHPGLWYQKGSCLLELGRHEEAVAAFEMAIKLQPGDFDSWQSKGHSLRELGRHEEAIIVYEKAIELKSDDSNSWHWKGICLSRLRRYEEAIEAIDEAISLNHYDLNFRETKLKFEEAIKTAAGKTSMIKHTVYVETSAEQIHTAQTLRYRRDVGLLRDGRFGEALIAFDQSAMRNPNDFESWYWKGFCLGKLNRFEEAVNAFNKAIELKHNDPNSWYWKALSLRELGRYEETQEALDKVIKLKPNDPNYTKSAEEELVKVRLFLANTNHEKSMNSKTDTTSEEIASRTYQSNSQNLDKSPFKGDWNSWFQKGGSLLSEGRFGEALEAFEIAIELKPDDSYSWWCKGVSLSKLNRHEEAIGAIDKAIELYPKDSYSWHLKGVCLGQLNRHKDALKVLDKAIELKPDYPYSWYLKGCALSKLNRHKEAIEAIAAGKTSMIKHTAHIANPQRRVRRSSVVVYAREPILREIELEFENAINFKTDNSVEKLPRENYQEKLRHPKWQKKRLEILANANWRCQLCGNDEIELQVHHNRYEKNRDPWDYPNSALIALCKFCHEKFSFSHKK